MFTLFNTLCQPKLISVLAIYKETETVIAIHRLDNLDSPPTKTYPFKLFIQSFTPHCVISLETE